MLPHESFRLLQQEGYLFRSCLTRGLTALRNANDSAKGNFYVAFFQLSIGLERLLKSAVVVHYMANNNLTLPSSGTLKALGHRLLDLFSHVSQLPLPEINPLSELDTGSISFEILTVLEQFARSTRYFNLDSLSAAPINTDPLRDYDRVIQRILSENVRSKKVSGLAAQRAALAKAVSGMSIAIDPGAPHQGERT